MAVLYINSCEHNVYNTQDGDWDYFGGVPQTTTVRTGNKALDLTGSGNVIKYLPNSTTLYVGFAFNIGTLTNKAIMRLSVVGASDTYFQLNCNVDGSLTVYRHNTSVVLGSTAIGTWVPGWNHVQIRVTAGTTTGAVELRINELTKLTLSSINTVMNSASAIYYNSVQFLGVDRLDDVWIADDQFYGDCKIYDLYPTGAGNYTQFTPSAGSNYQNVDDGTAGPDNDTTYNVSSTAGHKDSFTLTDLPAGPARLVYAVQVQSYARSEQGSNQLRSFIRVGGTDYNSDTESINTSYYTRGRKIWSLNPATSAAWTETQVNALESGYELIG